MTPTNGAHAMYFFRIESVVSELTPDRYFSIESADRHKIRDDPFSRGGERDVALLFDIENDALSPDRRGIFVNTSSQYKARRRAKNHDTTQRIPNYTRETRGASTRRAVAAGLALLAEKRTV